LELLLKTNLNLDSEINVITDYLCKINLIIISYKNNLSSYVI